MARRPVELVAGQLAMGAEEPWQPSECKCWPFPPKPRLGCQHCPTCDTCQDCRQCAGSGCTCACEREGE
ncbi:hypothetical protein [Streptomyces axinellae]|uniref:Metallothionein n=1 Tax=Streptomyces axinellae TaxID=552788 RepID=A0ABP6DAK7_9ACTN